MSNSERSHLTPAQWLVLERLAQGEGNAAIGQALGISTRTVAGHIRQIYQRLPDMREGDKRTVAATWYLTVGRALREQEESS